MRIVGKQRKRVLINNLRPIRWIILLPFLSMSGCQNAFLTLPGGQLTGIEVHVNSFDLASEYTLLQLEVRPDKPYSIWLRVVMRGDKLYIDAAQKRHWHKFLEGDLRVRIKLGETIYPARAILVTDQELLKQFLSNRTVYLLDPA